MSITTGLKLLPTFCSQVQRIRCISKSQILMAEPPRKRRRIDPAVLKVRVEKKIKKHEREIARIEREPRKLIPILEYQLFRAEREELLSRPTRKIEDFGLNEGIYRAAFRLWTFHRHEQSKIQSKSIRRVEQAQKNALEALKVLDLELYNRATEVDELGLLPYYSSQVKKETPPNNKYTPPDGYVKDVSREWVL